MCHQPTEGRHYLARLLVLARHSNHDTVLAGVVIWWTDVDLLVPQNRELLKILAVALLIEVLDGIATVVEGVRVLVLADLLVAGVQLTGLITGVIYGAMRVNKRYE